MKSPFFLNTPFSEEKRLLRLSFAPSLRRLFFDFSSSRTFAVSEAVAAFLIPPLGVRLPLPGCGVCLPESFLASLSLRAGIDVSAVPISSFFFRFLPDPEAFFKE